MNSYGKSGETTSDFSEDVHVDVFQLETNWKDSKKKKTRETFGGTREMGGWDFVYMVVEPKIGGVKTPKMDGENNGSNPIKRGWFGGTIIFGNTHMVFCS